MKYKIEKVAIKQDNAGNYRDEFFVDTICGKNVWVAKTEDEAKEWIATH